MIRAVRKPASALRHRLEALEQRIAPAALIALDNNNHLLAFDSATPGTVVTTAVTGLGAGETLIGIDFRPANGLLYGLTKDATGAGHVYHIDTNGTATLSALLKADPVDATSPFNSISGTNFGLNFNPVDGALRVVSDTNQNLRIDVDSGLVTTDAALNPAGATVTGAAYAHSFAGATGTTLYDLDVASDSLYVQNPPNNGTLTNAHPLGVNATAVGGFDILSTRDAAGAVTESAFSALTVGGVTGLYGIDLATGAASGGAAIGNGTTVLRGLTAVIQAPTGHAYTIDATNHLLSFDTATPNVTTNLGALSGIGAGESVIGLDFRGTNGLLYAVTQDAAHAGHLYTVNPATAAATALGVLVADTADTTAPYTALTGTHFDVDFNVAADRLRLVSDSGQNLQVDVNTFHVTTDPALNGATTGASGVAYVAHAALVTPGNIQYEIDPVTDKLYRVADPDSSGTLVEVGSLGVDATAVNGFDISAPGQNFANLTVAGVSGLYHIDLTTGAATFAGAIGTGAASTGFALAPSGTIHFANSTVSVAEDAGNAALVLHRDGGSEGTLTVFVSTATGTAGSADFTGVPRTVTFGPGVTSQTVLIPITDDHLYEGNETFTATLRNGPGASSLPDVRYPDIVSQPDVATVTIVDNETPPTISIGDVTLGEGNSGTKIFTFPVTLSGATEAGVTLDYATVDGTAKTADGDYVAIPTTHLTIPGGETSAQIQVTVNGDTNYEPNETFTVHLSNQSANATIAKANGVGTILNDDAHFISGKLVTYTDVDGDLVTVKTTVGTLAPSNFTLVPTGTHGGYQLQKLDLSSPTFINSNVTITAARTATGGDGFVNVGYLDALGNTLGTVAINGDLGQIDANAAVTLSVHSLGKLGLSTQGAGGSLQSTFIYNLPTLVVHTDVVDASISALNFTSATIGGNLVGGTGDHSGSIEAVNRIGALTIGGTLHGGADAASGSVIAKTVGALKIHEIDGGRIFIAGNPVGSAATPANLASALALGSLTVAGDVQNANILVGFDRLGAPVHAAVTTGAISVAGDWVASNLSAGVQAGTDGFYGSDTGAVIPGASAVVARIASITIKGQVYGTIANTTDRFGFVAEQIGAFTVGTTKLPLSSLGTPKDNLTIGSTDDVMVREY